MKTLLLTALALLALSCAGTSAKPSNRYFEDRASRYQPAKQYPINCFILGSPAGDSLPAGIMGRELVRQIRSDLTQSKLCYVVPDRGEADIVIRLEPGLQWLHQLVVLKVTFTLTGKDGTVLKTRTFVESFDAHLPREESHSHSFDFEDFSDRAELGSAVRRLLDAFYPELEKTVKKI